MIPTYTFLLRKPFFCNAVQRLFHVKCRRTSHNRPQLRFWNMAVVQNHPTFSFSPEGQPWVSPFVLGGKHACLGIEMASLKTWDWEPSVRSQCKSESLVFVAVASGRTTAQTTQNGLSDWRPELQMPRDWTFCKITVHKRVLRDDSDRMMCLLKIYLVTKSDSIYI